MHRKIGVGETHNYRFIDVEPPLTDKEALRMLKVVTMPEWLRDCMDFHVDILDDVTEEIPPYTEYCVDLTNAKNKQGKKTVDRDVMELARSMGEVLVSSGDTYELLEPIIPTDSANPIFGAKADEKRAEMRSHMNEHQEAQER